MTRDERERATTLLFQIENEKDPHRYAELVRELYEVIRVKHRRISGQETELANLLRTRPWKMIPGFVRKVLKVGYPVERLEISIPSADELFREIRIDNAFTSPDGRQVGLVSGVAVDVTLEGKPRDAVRPDESTSAQ
jgi:hypothetical protein